MPVIQRLDMLDRLTPVTGPTTDVPAIVAPTRVRRILKDNPARKGRTRQKTGSSLENLGLPNVL